MGFEGRGLVFVCVQAYKYVYVLGLGRLVEKGRRRNGGGGMVKKSGGKGGWWVAWQKFPFSLNGLRNERCLERRWKKKFMSIFLSTLGKINILIEAMTLVSLGRSLFEDGIASRNGNWSDPVKECGVFPLQALNYFL